MPQQSEYVGANMIEYELPNGSRILVHPDDVEQFEKQQATMQIGANDAAIMQKLREQHRGEAQPATAAKPKRVSDAADAEAKAQARAEDKAAKGPKD